MFIKRVKDLVNFLAVETKRDSKSKDVAKNDMVEIGYDSSIMESQFEFMSMMQRAGMRHRRRLSPCVGIRSMWLQENGLDFNRNFSLPKVQLEVFKKPKQKAVRLRKSLFPHEKGAHGFNVDQIQGQVTVLRSSLFTGNASHADLFHV
ncbi:unnamed protein product [Allacma fusca]|uniref:Uncharacterized protein n=1 Tax=Allacma fusca TaxID=39272 RepID=A0A8J2JI96_9HEXA|nr:unnamed protein product [Allacma fusca]